jgi:hypothetical protein
MRMDSLRPWSCTCPATAESCRTGGKAYWRGRKFVAAAASVLHSMTA